MPRENSFSDSDGRSLTPDLEEGLATSPTYAGPPATRRSNDNTNASAENRYPQHHPLKHSYTSPTPAPLTTPQQQQQQQQQPIFLTPTVRFRSAVRKVIAMRSMSSLLARRGVGAEPGADPRSAAAFLKYGHIRQRCTIEVNDYSTTRVGSARMDNSEFLKFLGEEGERGASGAREPWVRVRWIDVGGISWDVISALALKYDLHPLAVEDVLHQRGHPRSKADYYPQHLFVRILVHTLASSASSSFFSDDRTPEDTSPADMFASMPRSESPAQMDDEEEADLKRRMSASAPVNDDSDEADERTVFESARASVFSTLRRSPKARRRKEKMSGIGLPWSRPRAHDAEGSPRAPGQWPFAAMAPAAIRIGESSKKARYQKLVGELKKGDRVDVQIHPMCVFLLRDGTVVSIHNDTTLALTAPIAERLRQRDTVLRTSADPALLVQSLLDLVVDQALEVVEEYQGRILEIEEQVLLKPSMKTVRRLHILQGDLVLHKRTLEPVKTLIYGLRRYDADRALALRDPDDGDDKTQLGGYMSHKAKIYLADVYDHMEYILASLDMVAGITENLMNYTFNMASYEMNEVMRRLTTVTIICLPLTLLTGYFGMNFTPMWSVNHNSDLLFWEIAIPVILIVVPLFMWGDIRRMRHYLDKSWRRRRINKVCLLLPPADGALC
ncbi:hypothetical protein DICSQDRAFT_71711 [Dichomitus squalens LYAD-421 SS1]|uniref:Cora-domain-containing protein n=1 Tax=Dichomitus squalens (strain LYAD-421) TaxID=732165 RepID=R7SKS0_DICSQ|nr:uncharacterized protein DICSQDRAFT_71711 [Dichomitus squalens LYAD-421 SS1]EJF56330.1 hypothetical protein DICSQDRAFT_71711 [Dichomitus squalens LYAD-421 SS1]